MRTLITLCTVLLLVNPAVSSDSTIVFRQIGYSEIFDLARLENKAVFLYFHFNGCGACVTMENSAFKDSSVAEYINSNFIPFEINTREGEGIETNKIYNVRLHPAFIYLDAEGRILHKTIGVFSPEDFLSHARKALDSERNLSSMQRLYEQGNRNSGFLYEYTHALRDAFLLDSTVVKEYLESLSLADLGLDRNLRYLYEFAVHNFSVMAPFESGAFQFLLFNKEKYYEFFEPDQVDARIVWIVNDAVYRAIENGDEALFNKGIRVLGEFDTKERYLFKEMDGRTTGIITSRDLVLTAQMAFYEKSGDSLRYNEALERYIQKIWDDSEALNTMAWNSYLKYDSEDRLSLASKWVQRSIELNSAYANNDTYAWILFKLGDIEAALFQAEKAIDIASKENKDYQETRSLLEQIRGDMRN